ncbi:MAG: hypothetical protein ACKVQW_00370 [Pyrinomonadaceae bacterium]
MLLKDLVETELLGLAATKLRSTLSHKRFSHFFLDSTNSDWALILSSFATKQPWTYWDESTVQIALTILEQDVDRTLDAIALRSRRIGIAFENLFRLSDALIYEETIDSSKASDLLKLSTEFHPEYLRINEHIFANLISFYWSVLKNGGVDGKFDIRKADALLRSKKADVLLNGYDDKVRNAIAHGEIVYKGTGLIQYGDDRANYTLGSSQFLRVFDEQWRTCNALAIGILLLLARNEEHFRAKGVTLPTSLVALFASGMIERKSLSAKGVLESETVLAGKQLHIFIRTSMLNHITVMYDCVRIAGLLIKHGAREYERFVFDIDQNKTLTSQLIINAQTLRDLLDNPDTQLNQIGIALDNTPLLWFNESLWVNRLKVWKEIAVSSAKQGWYDLQETWEEKRFRLNNSSYRILKTKDMSSTVDRRVHIYAVLTKKEFANDREYIKEVVRRLVKHAYKVKVRKDTSLSKGISFFGTPTYIWVSLYKANGPFRWVTQDGWLGGNLIATAEKVTSFFKEPISEKNPHEIWKGIRFRFSMDEEAYYEAAASLEKTFADILAGKDKK